MKFFDFNFYEVINLLYPKSIFKVDLILCIFHSGFSPIDSSSSPILLWRPNKFC